MFKGFKSEADGAGFFLSDQGKYNPEAELEATLTSFFDPPQNDPNILHPQCKFPARYAWLKKELGFPPGSPPEQPCARFKKWRSRLDAESVTIIFASAYLDNPASMYGHTFLRLNRKGHKGGERLLDYTVNFAAITDTTSGIIFALKGLTGLYHGAFSTLPYYIKVQEYNNLQDRELWEYDLNLSDEQIDRLVMHLWEMGSTYFDYYFVTENCSYQLLPLLEVAEPNLDLIDPLKFGVVPLDTVRLLLEQNGLVLSVRHRPSHRSQMLARRSHLTLDEIDAAGRIAKGGEESRFFVLDRYQHDRQAFILDAAYDYFRYQHGFRRDQTKDIKLQERAILLRRSKLKINAPEAPESIGHTPPHYGHKSGRIGFSFGVTKDSSFEEISFRPALHDLVAADTGYVPGSHLEMFALQLRYDNENRKTFIEDLNFLEIISLSPLDPWVYKPSWKIRVHLDQAKELGCSQDQKCLYFDLNMGRGYAFETKFWKREILYGLVEGDIGLGGILDDNYRLGGGVTTGLLIDLASFWRIHLEGTYVGYPVGDTRPKIKAHIIQAFPIFSDIDFRLKLAREASHNTAHTEMVFSMNIYH